MIEGLAILVCVAAVFAALALVGCRIISKMIDLVFGEDDEERQDIHRH